MMKIPATVLVAALALGALPAPSLAGEAPAAGAANQADTEKQLAEAQRQLNEAARRVAELSRQLGDRAGNRFFMFRGEEGPPPRSVIGVQIDNTDAKGGAKVLEVSPGGAAAEAGIKPGDLITAVAGQDISKEDNPSRALVDKVRELEPNLKVQVGLLRDGKKLSVDITPRPAPAGPQVVQRLGGRGFGGPPGLPGLPGMPGERRIEIHTTRDGFGGGTRFHGIEFATLSEKLGGYFGVKSGVLVVRAGNDPAFKLQDGDVILAIDGREPTSAQHAGRILRSYSPGEKLTLKVQRDRKALNLEVTAPGGRPGDGDDD